MSVSNASIPRLQEIAMLEEATLAVERGDPFEQVRLSLIDLRRRNSDDPEDPRWDRRIATSVSDVHNVVDSLKELMQLKVIERSMLPSTPSSSRAHRADTYELTPLGREWAELLRSDRAAAYNRLVGWLIENHHQFDVFLRTLGARPDSVQDQFTIPLLRWAESRSPHTVDSFLQDFGNYRGTASTRDQLGWSLPPPLVVERVETYVNKVMARATAAGRTLSNKVIEREAERALIKTVFGATGLSIDYLTVEILRRWSRYLGLATFSYQAAQPRALRLWATAVVTGSGDSAQIERRIGSSVRDRVLRELGEVLNQYREPYPT